jgi:hypothetical protein
LQEFRQCSVDVAEAEQAEAERLHEGESISSGMEFSG